jgi:N-acetylglucosaminyl-diphospho-decaprenol L-rhamnosyltransferase
MDLSIIIVNWNAADFIIPCVKSIQEQTQDISYEIIVVDNNSAKQDVEQLRNLSEITVITCEENLGFARANNLGFSSSIGDCVLFLNPDTEVIGPAINAMVNAMKSLPDAGVVGCKLLNTDMSVQLSSIQKFPTILNQVFDAEYLQLRWPRFPLWDISPLFAEDVKLAQVEVVSGACMLVRREVFKQVEMFSEDYFMYVEDVDLSYKTHCAGFANYYVGNASIIHHGGKSSSKQQISYWATTMKYRAVIHLLKKTKGELYAVLYRTAMGCVAVVRLTLLGVASMLGSTLCDRESLRFSVHKWKTVLKWAIGADQHCCLDKVRT